LVESVRKRQKNALAYHVEAQFTTVKSFAVPASGLLSCFRHYRKSFTLMSRDKTFLRPLCFSWERLGQTWQWRQAGQRWLMRETNSLQENASSKQERRGVKKEENINRNFFSPVLDACIHF